MPPKYDLDKIKFATDAPTFERAVGIYELGGIKDFEDVGFGFSAKIRGSGGNFYQVYISAKQYDRGNCDCYLGQNDTLCKHMVALAIYSVKGGKPLTDQDRQHVLEIVCSGRKGALKKAGLIDVKAEISAAMRCIKPYNGPSRIWFSYQNSLSEGCNRLSKIISELPVSRQTAELLVNLLLQLDKKLCCGGVDDSDGTVGGFIQEAVKLLQDFAKLDPSCINEFQKLKNRETSFGWEEPLLEIANN